MQQLISNRLFEVPIPEIRKGCILVRTEYASVSGNLNSINDAQAKKLLDNWNLQNPIYIIDKFKHILFYHIKQFGLKNTFNRFQAKNEEKWINHVSSQASITGIVDDVADNVSEFIPGDRVAAVVLNAPQYSDFYAVPTMFCKKIPVISEYKNVSGLLYASIAAYVLKQLKKNKISCVKLIGNNLFALTINQLLTKSGLHVLASKSILSYKNDEKSRQDILICGNDCLNFSLNDFQSDRVWLIASDEYYLPEHVVNSANLQIIGFPDPNKSNLNPYSDLPLELPPWLTERSLDEGMALLFDGVIKFTSLIHNEVYMASKTKSLNLKNPTLLINDRIQEKARAINLEKNQKQEDTESLRVSIIGAGRWARGMIIPFISKQKGIILRGVTDWDPFTARHTGHRFGFEYCSTDNKIIIGDPKTDAVFIMTYHDSHSQITADALKKGKAVFVEKPLALNFSQLKMFKKIFTKYGGFVAVGYNRRYAPATKVALKYINDETGPITVVCSTRSWDIPSGDWYYWPKEGTRIASNACHWIDFCYLLVGKKRPVSITNIPSVKGRKDENYSITINFVDGSIAVIIYSNRGDYEGHELIDIKRGGTSIIIDDFRTIQVIKNGKRQFKHWKYIPQKGHDQEIKTIIKKIKSKESSPTSFEDIVNVSSIIFHAREASYRKEKITVRPFDSCSFSYKQGL